MRLLRPALETWKYSDATILMTSGGLGLIFAMTCLGAAAVFFFRRTTPRGFQQMFLGFAAGVMIAASVWSLLIPAIEEAEARD